MKYTHRFGVWGGELCAVPPPLPLFHAAAVGGVLLLLPRTGFCYSPWRVWRIWMRVDGMRDAKKNPETEEKNRAGWEGQPSSPSACA